LQDRILLDYTRIENVVFDLIDKLTSKKYAKTTNFPCKGNKVFVKYQGQEGDFNPNPPSLRTPVDI